jgi:NAD(P)-dependent dehydrogenase (short-subunit alcohol dehydrogenase family)
MKNHYYIITGAGSGIGQALAIMAARQGEKVIIADINKAGLAKTEAEIQQNNGWVKSYLLDVSNAEQITDFAENVLKTYIPEYIVLVNNAGVALASGTFAETNLVDFEWLLNINLWGVIRMTKAFLPYMIAKNQGHIVNVSSVFGLGGFMHQSAYSTAKFGVKGFTDVLKMEFLGTNLIATSVHPGGIKTNIARGSRLTLNITKEEFETQTKEFEKTFINTPEFAAKTILRGILKKKSRILIGNDAIMIDFFTRFLANSYHKVLRKFLPK